MPAELDNPSTRYFQTRRIVTDDGERFIEWQPPRFGMVPERLYVVTDADLDRPDTIALKTLGDDRLWWMVMVYNNITDPMSLDTGDKLRIPQFAVPVINSPAEVLVPEPTAVLQRRRCVSYPPFQDPDDIVTTTTAAPSITPTVILTFGFPVPPCLSGLAHFQIQASTTPDFLTVVLSKISQASVTRWYYYNPAANNSAGGFVAFPTAGIDAALLSGQTVYHSIVEGELDPDNIVYCRFRVWYNKPGIGWLNSEWYAPPAIQIP